MLPHTIKLSLYLFTVLRGNPEFKYEISLRSMTLAPRKWMIECSRFLRLST